MLKYLFFFLFGSQLCFSQKTIFDTIYLNPNFHYSNLTDDQKETVAAQYRAIKPRTRNSGDSIINAYNRINLYTYSLLDNEQKAAYEKSWNRTTENKIKAEFRYLNLSADQVKKLLDIMQNFSGADTSKIITHHPVIPKDSLMVMLDSMQLVLENEHQNEKALSWERYLTESDPEKGKDTAFERYRLDLVTNYYSKHLRKAKRKAIGIISKIQMQDVQRIEQITTLYQARVISDMKLGGERNYSRDSILIAPISKKLNDYKYRRYALQPNLCVYWCRFGIAITPQTKAEENKIVEELEYLKKTYNPFLIEIMEELKSRKAKMQIKIEAARVLSKCETIVNIVADGRIQALDDIAELLLAKQ